MESSGKEIFCIKWNLSFSRKLKQSVFVSGRNLWSPRKAKEETIILEVYNHFLSVQEEMLQ